MYNDNEMVPVLKIMCGMTCLPFKSVYPTPIKVRNQYHELHDFYIPTSVGWYPYLSQFKWFEHPETGQHFTNIKHRWFNSCGLQLEQKKQLSMF
jgi:hypothetical protein